MKTSDIPTEDILIAYHNKTLTRPGYVILFEQYPDCPYKVMWSAIEREDDRGYLDYGTSLNTAWVTEKGYKFLESKNIKL